MSNWKSEHDKDHYYKKAKKERYRSRASFKLLQLNKKFKIIKKGDQVLDLGAAPGGWSQVALELSGNEGLVLAVDLQRIKRFENENFYSIRGDFTKKETIEKIYEILENKADVIISDASPKLSGIRDIDHLLSIELAETVLNISGEILKPGGNIIIKAFQGEEFRNLLQKIKKMFRLVKTTKPQSSKQKSSEMYIIAKGFR
ncbi:MAG: 23S rRNA (uridine(2552)-2'-O)-methyltransferase [Methanobacteriaceae archaeon]|jgi:23S rRNA (uridine2552-2'-O)-methyltransferase|nr:MAG: 23S rRNA (uridine(2552)-2'-O)-methyltransferase [Methanobacterium sp. BRmetb2]MCC7557638.1 23S rRNA (uridine(2552)-2'-O)-methyltransferase [Methanobacteriaceae archaeon]